MCEQRIVPVDNTWSAIKIWDGLREVFSFKRRRLARYWPNARRKTIEGVEVRLIDNLMMLHFSEASGQAGCLAIVDVTTNRVIHVSSGAFVNDVTILGGQYVFVVLNIAYYGHSSSWHVEWRDLHSKVDVCKGSNTIARIDIPDSIQFGGRFTQVQPALTFSEGFDVVLTGGGDQFNAVFPKEISEREA